MKTAFYPGSFNPFTIGHKSVVDRVLPLFDRVVVAVGCNIAKERGADFEHDAEIGERLAAIRRVFHGDERVEVMAYSGLTVDAAQRAGATCIVRGVRSVADYEQEVVLADVNRRLASVETLLIPALPDLACVSSSMVRELAAFGHDVAEYLP